MRQKGFHPDEHKLSLLAGGDLAFPGRWFVARHVARCPDCAAAVAAYASARAELRSLPPAPEVDFRALAHRIRVEVAQTGGPAPRNRIPRWAAPVGLGAASAAVAVVLLLPLGSPGPAKLPRAAMGSPEPEVQLLHEGAEAQLTADGGLSVRSFHPGSGALTITDYYAP